MIWAFLLGLTVDILGNTPGMNAAAATVLAFMREPVLRLVTLRDSVEDFEPGIKSMDSRLSSGISYCVLSYFVPFTCHRYFFILQPACLIVEILTDASITIIVYCVLRRSGGKIVERDYNLEKRKYVIGASVIVIVLIYLIRLFTLQIMSEDYKRTPIATLF